MECTDEMHLYILFFFFLTNRLFSIKLDETEEKRHKTLVEAGEKVSDRTSQAGGDVAKKMKRVPRPFFLSLARFTAEDHGDASVFFNDIRIHTRVL